MMVVITLYVDTGEDCLCLIHDIAFVHFTIS